MNIDESKYHSEELQRPTTAPSYESTTVIKYMATRTLCPNRSNSFHGSLRHFDLSNSNSNFMPSPLTTTHGLASLVGTPTVSRVSSLDSIDGELIRDEHRDLSKLTETLTETVLHCSSLDVHNRAQELQLDWLDKNANRNSSTIEKMFRTEIQTGRQLIENTLRYKTDFERQLNDIHQSTLANDEHYQQLLAKRNAIHQELFEYQRQLAQNRAESEFLRSRIQMFDDEIQFYRLKNNSLEARKMKLQYEFDDEILAKQVLQMECEVLENEKITNEDIHLSSIDDIRGSIDLQYLAAIPSSTSYREQLSHEVRRMRLEYSRRIEIYRDELHRRFELESRRYKISQQRSIPTVTREHQQKLEEYRREKNAVDKQISVIREKFHRLENQIQLLEKQIDQTQITTEGILSSRRRLVMFEEVIREKEQQLDAVIRMRTKFKQQIENYQADLKRNEQPRKSILRTSTSYESIIDINSSNSRPMQSMITKRREPSFNEGTLVRFSDFNAERDCDELNTIFHHTNVNAMNVINVLCNRNVAQRLQIRETFRTLFGQNLDDVIDSEMNGNSKKLFKILLLSPIERDCLEFRRVLKGVNIEENSLIEIFLSHSNEHIQAVINHYIQLFKTTLEEDISNIDDTPSKQIFLALLRADRPKGEEVNEEEISNDARNLYQTNARWRRDGSTFIQLLSNRSNEQLKQIFHVYQQFSGIDIEQTIKVDTEADLSRTLMAIVRLVRNRSRFFAYELRKSLKSSSINEETLNRIIVSRCEIDMLQIQSEYEKISKRTLHDQIQMNTNGDYQRALLELLRQRIEPPKKPRRIVQWRETSCDSSDADHRKQCNRFDRNNQAKSTTLSTISPRLSRSQFLEQYSDE